MKRECAISHFNRESNFTSCSAGVEGLACKRWLVWGGSHTASSSSSTSIGDDIIHLDYYNIMYIQCGYDRRKHCVHYIL